MQPVTAAGLSRVALTHVPLTYSSTNTFPCPSTHTPPSPFRFLCPRPLMDSNITHESISSVNSRKRKAEGEDAQVSPPPDATTSETIMVDSVVAAAPNLFSNAPRQPPSAPWLSPPAGNGVWTSTNAPPISPLAEAPDEVQRSQKRPRIERDQLSPPPTKRHPRKPRPTVTFRPSPHPPSRFWSQSDIRDMGLVPTKDPERISDSLYHVKGSDPCAPECRHHLLPFPLPPIDVGAIRLMTSICT
jgi:hypothetical protein